MNVDYNTETQEITVELNTPAIEFDTPTGGRGLKGDTGDTGPKGDTGRTATITVGSTTTGDAGTSASVTNSGTENDAVLDFTIPKGDKGDTGATGQDGVSPTVSTSKSGKTTTVTFTDVNGTSTATILDGEDASDEWGSITGTLSDQTDLQDVLDGKIPYTEVTDNKFYIWQSEDGYYKLPRNCSVYYKGDNSNYFQIGYEDSYIYINTNGTGSQKTYILEDGGLYHGYTRADAGCSPREYLSKETIINDLTTTSSGFVLDARQGKTLKDMIDSIAIPTKVSDLQNDLNFIDNTVNNLTNYYTSSNTYTKSEVDSLIATVSSLNIEVVQTLPTQDISTSTIYLVPNSSQGTNNYYDEYIYVNNSWELIGSTQVDLSNYYTKTETDNLFIKSTDASSTYALKSLYNNTSIHVGRKANTTTGIYSDALGYNTEASGSYAYSEGNTTKATSNAAHAEGDHTSASGQYSHAEGYYTTASGKASHAEGNYTTAKGEYQHVSGKFNLVDNNNTYAEIIGNGSSDSVRSNARTLDWSGNEVLAGSLKVNGNQTVATTSDIPTKVSDLQNDAGYTTFSGDYDDLTDKPIYDASYVLLAVGSTITNAQYQELKEATINQNIFNIGGRPAYSSYHGTIYISFVVERQISRLTISDIDNNHTVSITENTLAYDDDVQDLESAIEDLYENKEDVILIKNSEYSIPDEGDTVNWFARQPLPTSEKVKLSNLYAEFAGMTGHSSVFSGEVINKDVYLYNESELNPKRTFVAKLTSAQLNYNDPITSTNFDVMFEFAGIGDIRGEVKYRVYGQGAALGSDGSWTESCVNHNFLTTDLNNIFSGSIYSNAEFYDQTKTYNIGDYVYCGEDGAFLLYKCNTNISTAEAWNSSHWTQVIAMNEVADKQDTLVSGTNIKTINNESLLGSGNINITSGGGTMVDMRVNGSSVVDANNVGNIATEGTYNASSNKIATMSDLPTNYVTTDTSQDVTGAKTFKNVIKIQNGQGTGSLWIGGDVNANTVKNNTRHLARISVPSYSDVTLASTLLGFDSSGDSDMHVTNKGSDAVSFGGMKKITNATSPMAIGFCVATERNGTASNKKVYPLEMDSSEARFNVQPNYNGANLATVNDIPTVPTKVSDLQNDAGYITGYTETDPVYSASAASGITSTDITNWNNKSDFSGSYTDLSNKPTIPTNVSDLNNDAGYITSYTETDPVFTASAAAGITSSNISDWNAKMESSHFTGDIRIMDLDDGVYICDTTNKKIYYYGTSDTTKYLRAAVGTIVVVSGDSSRKTFIVTDGLDSYFGYSSSSGGDYEKTVITDDIVNNLTTSSTGKPLDASQGKALKDLIDGIKDGTNIDSFSDVETALSSKADTSSLATVATTGAYSDLSGAPTIPTNTSDLNNDSNFAVTNADNNFTAGQTINGEVVVNSIRTKNLFDSATLVQGDVINAYPNLRISSRQAMWLEVGTYTFSTNISSSYNYGLQVQSVGAPPLSSYPTYIYDSGWQTASSKTFTINTAGWFSFALRRADNGTITSTDLTTLKGYNYQLEKGSTATAFTTFQNLKPEVSDTKWSKVSLTSDFVEYSTGTHPQYRRIGKVVFIRGALRTTTSVSSSTPVTMFTLPVGFRPSNIQHYAICQGSGMNRWLLIVDTNGDVTIGRYGISSGGNITTSDWLPFSTCFAID